MRFERVGLARQTRGCSVWHRGGAVVASPVISDGFRLRMARTVREPREDGVRSVGVPSMRRFWNSSASPSWCQAWAYEVCDLQIVVVSWSPLFLACCWGAAVGPSIRDCETERWFLCCVVRVGYWHHEPVVHSRVMASFHSDSWFATCRGLGVVTRRLRFEPLWCALVGAQF
ncbi:hypothetical protein Taro_036312 [Colocasia esculenta]|uniref:Uncharacterized protein n=1 Tax=Colocasia esculenta TaxID=4460 RepID=A0A843W198_COLES|nr:hypothetical protein [Colocasia esculenta]